MQLSRHMQASVFFYRAWDPPRTPLGPRKLHHNTKEMNANSFPQNMRFGPENRPGLLLFVAEPPGALYTYLVVSFA